MKNKKEKIVVFVAVVIIFISVALTYHLSTQDEDKYLTVHELYKSPYWRGEKKEGDMIYIKDTVINASIFYLPKMKVNRGEIRDKEGDMSLVKPIQPEIYTRVLFKSDEKKLYFEGNQIDRFPKGETVTFSLEMEYNESFIFYGKYPIVEPYRVVIIISQYQNIINNMYPISCSKELSDNGTMCKITITNVSNFFPLPTYWSEVLVGEMNTSSDLSLESFIPISLYDENGKLLGKFEEPVKKNTNFNFLITKGQYLKIPYDSQLGSIKLVFVDETSIRFSFWAVEIP